MQLSDISDETVDRFARSTPVWKGHRRAQTLLEGNPGKNLY